jgi:hypothetical protein
LGTFKLPVLNVGMIGGGTVFNAVPREAWFSVDLRSLDTPTQAQLEKASSQRRRSSRTEAAWASGWRRSRFSNYAKARPQAERLNSPLVQTAARHEQSLPQTRHARHRRRRCRLDGREQRRRDGNTRGRDRRGHGALRSPLEENADASSIVPAIKSLIALAVSLGGS